MNTRRPGRPPLPDGQAKKQMSTRYDPEVLDMLKEMATEDGLIKRGAPILNAIIAKLTRAEYARRRGVKNKS